MTTCRETAQEQAATLDFPGRSLVNLEHGELQCPGCRRLMNCLLPAATHAWTPALLPAAAVQAPAGAAAAADSAGGTAEAMDTDSPAGQPSAAHNAAALAPGSGAVESTALLQLLQGLSALLQGGAAAAGPEQAAPADEAATPQPKRHPLGEYHILAAELQERVG